MPMAQLPERRFRVPTAGSRTTGREPTASKRREAQDARLGAPKFGAQVTWVLKAGGVVDVFPVGDNESSSHQRVCPLPK